MLKYYLDKTGKVIKSILFPSSEFVDTEPREGSLNPVTSGGVAGSVSQQSSNFAPNYTKTTYPANSYVMQDGVLYTNPNAIGTAEDWDPAHWTQTTVAEMVANIPQPQTGYTSVTRQTYNASSKHWLDVNDKECITCDVSPAGYWFLNLNIASGTTDAFIRINVNRSNGRIDKIVATDYTIQVINSVKDVLLDKIYVGDVLYTTNVIEEHGGDVPLDPSSFSDVGIIYNDSDRDPYVVNNANVKRCEYFSANTLLIRIIGNLILVYPYINE